MSTTVLGPSKGYIDLLDEATTAKELANKANGREYQKTPIRPSAAGNCSRELFYQLMQYSGRAKYETETKSPNTVRLLSLGHSIEYSLIKQFELLSDVFEIRYKQQVLSFAYLEAKNDPKLSQWLEGSLDLVLWSDKYKCVADVKSKGDRFSFAHKSKWDEIDEKLTAMTTVKPISESAYWVENLDAFLEELNDPYFAANFLQLNLYANSQFLKERGVNHGAIIQYLKTDSRLREVRFKPSQTLYEKTVNKFQNVVTAVDTQNPELAPKDYVLGSIKCAYCPFKKECWPTKDATKAFYETFPRKEWPKDTDRMGAAGAGLEKLFAVYRSQAKAESDKEVTESAILKYMMDNNLTKIRLDNGEVYEAKQYTNSIKLKRGKA